MIQNSASLVNSRQTKQVFLNYQSCSRLAVRAIDQQTLQVALTAPTPPDVPGRFSPQTHFAVLREPPVRNRRSFRNARYAPFHHQFEFLCRRAKGSSVESEELQLSVVPTAGGSPQEPHRQLSRAKGIHPQKNPSTSCLSRSYPNSAFRDLKKRFNFARSISDTK